MAPHEKQLFLSRDSERSELDSYHDMTEAAFLQHKHRGKRIKNITIHVTLILLYTLVSAFVIRYQVAQGRGDKVIAGLDVRYRYQLYDKFNESPFAGLPNEESDNAWHTLMGNMSIRVSKEELQRHEQTSVALPGGGYLAWLGVFHELHCVKMVRQWSYREHYFPNMTEHDFQHQLVHIDHCLDWLRTAAMCHADTSALAVFKWDTGPHPFLNTHRVPHRCVDWDSMIMSHQDRRVSHEEVASMINPLEVLGTAHGSTQDGSQYPSRPRDN